MRIVRSEPDRRPDEELAPPEAEAARFRIGKATPLGRRPLGDLVGIGVEQVENAPAELEGIADTGARGEVDRPFRSELPPGRDGHEADRSEAPPRRGPPDRAGTERRDDARLFAGLRAGQPGSGRAARG